MAYLSQTYSNNPQSSQAYSAKCLPYGHIYTAFL